MIGFDWLKHLRAALGLSPRRPAPYRHESSRRSARLSAERLEDRTVPTINVLSASPAPAWTAVPLTTLDLTFDTAVNPTSVQTFDLNLFRNGSSFGASATAVQIVPGTNNQTVRFTVSGVTSPGQLTTYIRPGSIAAANDSTNTNATYTADYTLTSLGFTAVPPLGDLIYSGSNPGTTHTFAVDAGQTVTLVATVATPASSPLTVTLRGPATSSGPGSILGSATAANLSAAAVLQGVVAPSAGVYTATITGGPVTTGSGRTLKVYLNAVQEVEGTGSGATNSTPATAQDLSGAFAPLAPATGSPDRAGVVGTFAGPPDYYAVLLQAGQSVSAALAQTNPNDRMFNAASVVTQSPQVGTTPTDVAVGDLNGDGVPDLVHTLASLGGTTVPNGRIVVQYGTGNGKYWQGDAPSTGGKNPRAVRLADVNNDGVLDAIVANENDGTVAVLIGTGADPFNSDGPPPAFETAVTYDGGMYARDLAVGDLNGDGWLDIVVGNGYGNSVRVLLNNGDGTFGDTTTVSLGGLTYITNGVAMGDVTGDDIADVVAVTVDNTYLAVLPGDGTGAFAGPAIVTATGGSGARDVVLADFNGDGLLDAAVGHGSGNTVTVLLNQNSASAPFGPWTSAPGTPGSAGQSVNKIAAADFNGDGRIDLAATLTSTVASGATARVWLNNGTGGFVARYEFSLSGTNASGSTTGATAPDGLVAVDANGDGTPDLVAANTNSNNVSVLTNALSRLRIDLVDADGNVLEAGDVTANATSAFNDFVAPTGGTYYLRVSGEGRSDYAAVVTRGAAFEAERNETTNTAQPIGSAGVLGHVSAAQRVFVAVPGVSGAVGVIQELTPGGQVVRTFAAPTVFVSTDPVGLAFDGKSLFFVDWFSSHNIFELDPDTGAVRDSDTITIPFNGIDGLAALGGKVFVSGGAGGNELFSFDPVADTFGPILTISTINGTATGDLFGGIAGITGPNRLVATTTTSNGAVRVVEIDPATGLITSSFAPVTAAAVGSIRGVAVVEGQIYLSRLDNNNPRIEVYTRSGTYSHTISGPAQVTAMGGDDTASATDWYALEVGFQQRIQLATFTPADGPGGFDNTLNPRIELFDPSGTLVATGTPGTDGRNETIDFTGFSSGTYKVRVTTQSNTGGEYYLSAAYSTAPQAGDVSAGTDEETPVTIDVLQNASDQDGDKLYVAAVGKPAHGTAVLNADGTVTYQPVTNFTGNDAFAFTVADGHGGLVTATANVGVANVNDAPVVRDDAYTTDEDVTLTVDAPGVFANDTDVDAGDRFVYVEYVDAPKHGNLGLYDDGKVVYIPDANYYGSDQFTYRVRDTGGAFSNLATVTITVKAVNDAPFAGDYGGGWTEDRVFTLDTDTLQEITSDAEGDVRTVTEVTDPAHGTVVLNADGSVTYTPDANYFGLDSFDYTVTDGNGGFDTGTISFDIEPINDTPDARPDAYTTDEDAELVIDAADGVLANDTDVENDPLTAVLIAGPYHGDLALNDDGSFTYTPDANWHGADEFTYSAHDGENSGTVPIKVTLTVNPVNDAPSAGGATLQVNEDQTVAVDLRTLVADVETADDQLTFTVGDATNGTVTLDDGFTARFTPAANFNGKASFTYKVTDTGDGSAAAITSDPVTVAVEVAPVPDAPVANADSAATDEDVDIDVAVRANDTDADGDTLTVTAVTQGAKGTVTINADGTVHYAPRANVSGDDTFRYTISDGTGRTATATVTVTIKSVNDAPTVQDDTFSLAENSPAGTVVGTVTATDVDGDALTYEIVGGNAGGTFAIDSKTGKITVADPAALDYETTKSFTLTVRVTDPSGLRGEGTITVSLTDEAPRLAIDVLPGNGANEINLKKTTQFEVAILSSSEFDATKVDLDSIRFGRIGSENSVVRHPKRGVQYRLADVNGDGRLDLVVTIDASKTGLQVGDTKATLTCQLFGASFTDDDDVTVKNSAK